MSRISIKVKIIEARGIKAADIGGTSDPFCEVQIKNDKHIVKTKVIKKTLNPFWGEEFTIPVLNADNDVLQIRLYDYDSLSSNDLLGEIEIPVPVINMKGSLEEWRPLMKRKGHELSQPAQGELKLGLQYIDPSKPQTQPQQSQPQQQVPQQQYPPQQGFPQQQYPPQQGFPQQYPPQQGFPQQQYPPQQGFPQQYPPQQYPPQQGFPQQQYPPQQGFPQQYPPQQGFPQQQYPPQQGFPQQYPPQQGFPPHPQQGMPPHPQQGFAQQGFPTTQTGVPPGYYLSKKGKLKKVDEKKDKKDKKHKK